jgi:archaellum component FlaG (FlaF/FlaG flagellin family)
MTKNAAEIKSSLNTVFSIINDTEKISVRNANDFADKIEYISDAISSIKFHKLKTDNMTDKINTLKDSLNTILEIINTYNNVDVKHTRQFANKLSHVSDAINGIELIPGKIDIASLVNNRDNLIVLYDVIKDSN